MGTSLNVSHPPAITVDALPEMIFSAALVMATLEEIHACIYLMFHSINNVVLINTAYSKHTYHIYTKYTQIYTNRKQYIKQSKYIHISPLQRYGHQY